MNEASLNRWNITVLKLGNRLMDTVNSLVEQNNSNIFVYCSSELKVRQLLNEVCDWIQIGVIENLLQVTGR